MNLLLIIISAILLILFTNTSYCQSAEKPEQDEIQVLIDVSGSMKLNDPGNQRRDAAKLLLQLVPEKSKLALWLFAEKNQLLVQTDAVDKAWQTQAVKAVTNIHSKGLYTDIESAIKASLEQGFTGQGKKHLIILTDGIVDISKDIMVSADSRERIFSDWIPKLQQQDIHVQTIALSDQADKELLTKLAVATGGWAEQAQSAEQLQKVFLKMLLQAAPKNTLPLIGNHFLVDNSIKEFSLLAFKTAKSKSCQLVTPDQTVLDQHSTLPNVAWLATPAYDLVTIQQPMAGDWQLAAEVDPDNQVMIMTDLQMHVGEVPKFISESDRFTLSVHFTEQQKLIERVDFLKLLTIHASVDQQAPQNLIIDADQLGFFKLSMKSLAVGKHQIKIVADGKTFKRDTEIDIEVIPEPIKVETVIDKEQRAVTLTLQPVPGVIAPDSLAITASISHAGGVAETKTLIQNEGVWAINLGHLAVGSEIIVNFNVLAKTLTGEAISPSLKPIKLDDSLFAVSEPAPVTHEQPNHAESSETTEPDSEATSAEEEEEGHSEEPDWRQVAMIVLLVNVVLVVVIYYLMQFYKKSKAAKQQQLLGRLS